MELYELAPEKGQRKNKKELDAVLPRAMGKPPAGAAKAKTHAQAVGFGQVMKAARCPFTADCRKEALKIRLKRSLRLLT